MIFLDVALIALVGGKLLGGRMSGLADVRVVRKWLAFAAIGLQLIAFPSGLLPWTTPSILARGLWLASYVLLILVLAANRRIAGTLIMAGGLACNLVAILANHGLMPVRKEALQALGVDYHVQNNSIQLAHANLGFLIDRWAVPSWLPMANVYSVGDVLIAVGTLVAIVATMKAPRPEPDGAHETQLLGVASQPGTTTSSPHALVIP
jgi:hypothetical protein